MMVKNSPSFIPDDMIMPDEEFETRQQTQPQTQAQPQMQPQTQAQPQMPIMPPPFEQPENIPTQPISAPVFYEELPETPAMSTEYTQGFLETQIGQRVKIEFLLGSNILTDRTGILQEVGISYVVLFDTLTNTLLLCDIFSIKFVRFYR